MSTRLLLSAASSDDDTDYRGRRYDPTVIDPQNLGATRAKSRQYGPGGREFFRGRLAFDREDLPGWLQHARGPADETVKRRDRSSGGDVRPDHADHLLRSAAYHGRVRQAKPRHALVEEDGSPQHRLKQDYPYIGPEHGEHHPGQASARAYVNELTVLWHKIRY